MPLDFVQVDSGGNLTGRVVQLQRDDYRTLFWQLPSDDFPLLARMGDYFQDATFESSELPALARELRLLATVRGGAGEKVVLQRMVDVVEHSISNGLDVEVIAD